MAEFVSTRDVGGGEVVNYTQAIVEGLAPDGGLYTPVELPEPFSWQELGYMSKMTYTQLFTQVKSVLLGDDIPPIHLADITNRAFCTENFPEAVNCNVVPVEQIGDTNLYLHDLSGGPTAAFKDMALQPLARELDYVLGVDSAMLELLGATSGDTGSAAEAAVKGLGALSICMLSPKEGMSPFQRAQMGILSGGNVTNIAVQGDFDACQDLVKDTVQDPEFATIGAVNSINIGRILSQVSYYFSGYFQTVDGIGEQIDIVVPSGNFGNVLAGHIARSMGLPIRNLIVATNENDVLHELVQTGVYRKRSRTKPTSSPSMDITKASNYERLVYQLLGNNPERTHHYMHQFATKGVVSFEDYGMPADTLQRAGFLSGMSTEQDRLDSIRWTHETGGQIIDPHTADAITVARQRPCDVKTLCLSTARPVKFEYTIFEALGIRPSRPDRFTDLEAQADKKEGAFITIPPNLDVLKRVIRDIRINRPQ